MLSIDFSLKAKREKSVDLVCRILMRSSSPEAWQIVTSPMTRFFNEFGYSLREYIREKMDIVNQYVTVDSVIMALNICMAIIRVRDALNDDRYLPESVGNNLHSVVAVAFSAWKGNARASQFLGKIREALRDQYEKQSSGKVSVIDFEQKVLLDVLRPTSEQDATGLESNTDYGEENNGAILLTEMRFKDSRSVMYSNAASGSSPQVNTVLGAGV